LNREGDRLVTGPPSRRYQPSPPTDSLILPCRMGRFFVIMAVKDPHAILS